MGLENKSEYGAHALELGQGGKAWQETDAATYVRLLGLILRLFMALKLWS